MRRLVEHADIGAGAEDALLARGEDDGAHFGMFETQALHGIVQFDIDAQIVGIELQLVAGTQAAIFAHIHRQRGDGAVEAQLPVLVLAGLGAEIDRRMLGAVDLFGH